ncbi:MAG: type II toxin-antitoxin system VapC family toxin [Gammaproteobacteria bacterium]|nr:type II toxin-antitoxin system VapC family toxin [Gammaproteobacteria bacterium]
MGTVRVLLDTHALLWWLFDDKRLSALARKLIAAADNDLIVSSASAWEITTKYRIGKLPSAGDVPTRLPVYLRKARMSVLTISLEHAMVAGALPGPHRDPFDRMLIAQSQLEHMPVITVDSIFRDYGVRTCW